MHDRCRYNEDTGFDEPMRMPQPPPHGGPAELVSGWTSSEGFEEHNSLTQGAGFLSNSGGASRSHTRFSYQDILPSQCTGPGSFRAFGRALFKIQSGLWAVRLYLFMSLQVSCAAHTLAAPHPPYPAHPLPSLALCGCLRSWAFGISGLMPHR